MIEVLLNQPIRMWIVIVILAILVIWFIFRFLTPGIFHWIRLSKILREAKAFKRGAQKQEFKKLFSRDKYLSHLWNEYEETLHEQRIEKDGIMKVIAIRSTVPADAFFNSQYVVESRLGTEFFKHLPGIFTGIGIIGTFLGLIDGLNEFKVSEDANVVRNSLELLMHAVGEAFIVSASAIGLAMIVTLIEKLLLTRLNFLCEIIAHTIDSHYESGAGEEYLSSLVKSSAASATQAKILKDALVNELGTILRELTESQLANSEKVTQQLMQRIESASLSQMNAAKEDNLALGGVIASSIENSLKGPLEDIASTVRTASGDQSSTAVQMLQDVMVSFSQRLNDLFGGQITGINELNKQTAKSMQDAVFSLNALVAKFADSSKQTAETMASQLVESMKVMEERQAKINSETQEFVEQLKVLIENSQSETNKKLQVTLESIGQNMSELMESLRQSQNAAFEGNQAREAAISERTSGMISSMTGSVEEAVKEIATASQVMSQSVSALTSATTNSIDKMTIGAERINAATTQFSRAGEQVGAVMELASQIGTKLTDLSSSLATSSNSLRDGMNDYKAQRDGVSQLMVQVKATIEMAKREASLTEEVLKRIEESAQRLSIAQKSADQYLEGVNRVLAESVGGFSSTLHTTLDKANLDFHQKLSSAVNLLGSAIQDLEGTLGSIPSRR